ncbi:MAG: ATP-binding protein [Rhodocyclaceae bacterium]|nr:ATP-binding protein [Rhodocyclaceae bacterium]
MLTTLVQNAVQHGFEGRSHGVITIEAENRDDNLMLIVADNGIGMTPATLAHVFDPFFTTKLGKGGSGLGLSVSHRLATRVLGGSLTVSSATRRWHAFHSADSAARTRQTVIPFDKKVFPRT